jgi:predicted O-methyltransferase YrrM
MKSLNLTPELYQYLLELSPKENFHLKELRIKTDKLKYARLRSPTEQINFMMFLLQNLKPKNILEIGTFTGYSTLAMALATPEDTQIITCDINNVFPSTGQEIWKNAGVANRIKLQLGPAIETLTQLQQQSQTFDFVFIDADKENYWQYFEKSLNMLTVNGLIIIDNVLWRGQVIDGNNSDLRTNAIRDFNQRLSLQPHINYCLLPLGDGISLVSKK